MANKVHVRKGDTVIVLNGKDRYKKDDRSKDRDKELDRKTVRGKGKILNVDAENMMVLIEGVNMCKKHKKPRGRYQQGGIINQESPIHASKVMLVCPKCGEPSKTRKVFLDNGEKARECKKCKEQIDIISKAE